ncbi:hypothetical protein FLONG3_3920 [Fusarium longipes]|uniref:ubiquitinyl hydrolase 1 n=1 Tax=Fusarium longipes TaxID=694270 RepID=A0A395SZQ6_9HYPO|nr:hypothetical protein FLONG3_3920 [Fusarium longipes]
MDITSSKNHVDYLFHHLFLPAKLPGGDDTSASNTAFLIDFVLKSLRGFVLRSSGDDVATVQPVISMMQNMQNTMNSDGLLDSVGIQKILQDLSRDNPVVVFHVAAQNAGLLIRKLEDSFCLETLELSPTNSAAMTTKGRLIRQFPDTATEILAGDFQNVEFREVLANTIVKMSHQKVAEAQPTARKAGKDHHEDRETTNPCIVTELLTSIVRGIGKPIKVRAISKNTHEETSYSSSKLPWRRSPVWLLIRVGLQLTLKRLSGGSDAVYKRFMTFLMAQALFAANNASAPSEQLHVMMAKISRRLRKLQGLRNDNWLLSVRDIVSSASKELKKRWDRIHKSSEKQLDIKSLSSIKMEDHLQFSMPDIDNFIASISDRGSIDDNSAFSPVSHISLFDVDSLPSVQKPSDSSYIAFNLAVIESWVRDNLDQWIRQHLSDESVCSSLKVLLESYHSMANNWYASRPEGASRMFLTIGEIWVAVDKAALHTCPLLNQYSAEVPTRVWQALLLQSKTDMMRLQRLEKYLQERNVTPKLPSVFHSFGDPNSFASQYFKQSSNLQRTKAFIEETAQQDKQAKIEEFYRLKDQYKDSKRRHDITLCGEIYEFVCGVGRLVHDPACHRCCLWRAANNLRIQVHEWPLPTDTLEAQAVVFELDVPQQFAAWRDVTFYFINDVLDFTSMGSRPSSSHPLDSYSGLSPWCTSVMSRVHLLSETKSHLVTHRSYKSISYSDVTDVCLENGLKYSFHDRASDRFIVAFTETTKVSELCTAKLSTHASALQPFLARTWLKPNGETPNQVIASQSKCPEYMTLGEFKALAILPYGYRLQWMSVLTQLAMPTVDFDREETAIFLLQMSLQAGPDANSEVTREAHRRLTDVEFARQLLEMLSQQAAMIEKNWDSHTAMCSFILLAIRLLSLASPSLHQEIIMFLHICRTISYQWLKTLITKVQDTTDDKQRKEFSESAITVALICVQTFNIDDDHMAKILKDSMQASILFESSIVIYNSTPATKKDRSPLQSIMDDRTAHTLHRTHPVLIDEVVNRGNQCLDLAIERSWPDFSRTSKWSATSSSYYWLETTSGRRQVNFNVLTGELLVNGVPLARLPREYTMHKDYERLFGCMILDVMPSDEPSMRFTASRDFHGYTVHFGMQEQDLLVQLIKSGSCLDLIPSRLLRGIVPHLLSDNYAHWFRRETETIQFCELLNSLAVDDHQDWSFTREDIDWKLKGQGHSYLVAVSSHFAEQIAMILDPLEESLGLHLVYNTKDQATEIRIPNLRMDFFVKSGQSSIVSRQFRDMHIDSDQSIRTLVGLKSKLVLASRQDSTNRTVLIPEGKVRHELQSLNGIDKHTVVTVIHGSARRVQAYKLDDILGRLVGGTRTESKLYLAYLHGLTSFCLPDPFIGRTGTEEALDILGSAIIRATGVLNYTSYNILALISSLAPTRSFYPKNEKVMQVTKWSSRLSYMSQDDRFYLAARDIISKSHEISFLYPGQEVPECPDFSTISLVERAINRASRGQVSGFGAEQFTNSHDVKYTPRTQRRLSERAIRAQNIAGRIYHSECDLFEKVDTSFVDHVYRLLSADNIDFTKPSISTNRIRYDAEWLGKPEMFLFSDWCQIHHAFQKDEDCYNKFERMVWLATISFSNHYDAQVTQALLAISQNSPVTAVELPEQSLYVLSKGCTVVAQDLINLAENKSYSLYSSPEASLQCFTYESTRLFANRRNYQFEKNKRQAVETFVKRVSSQWPCQDLIAPSDDCVHAYLECASAMESLKPTWTSWYKNLRFRQYLERTYDRLRGMPIKTLQCDAQTQEFMITQLEVLRQSTGFISIDDLFHSVAPLFRFGQISSLDVSTQNIERDLTTVKTLSDMICDLNTRAKLPFEQRYLNELQQSLSTLNDRDDHRIVTGQIAKLTSLFQQNLEDCTKHTAAVYQTLSQAILSKLAPNSSFQSLESTREIWKNSGYLPRITPLLLLQQLRPSRFSSLAKSWQTAILDYAISVTASQRAKRLLRFQSSPVDLLREIQNPGHDAWEVWDHPEWLLLECESEIMIRDVQHQIARTMISPPNNSNAVMQLNMGEGKSTVIVPMVAATLADRSKIVRVIVAKPQAKQMYRMLVSKLAGLLDRPVYLLPFSRDIRMDTLRADSICRLVEKCKQEGGVLMVQPEHLLSLQLMELECDLNKDKNAARRLGSLRRQFDHLSRDIVDESDENFSVKFELVYTLGQQRSIEDSPSRWMVIQQVLGLIATFAGKAKAEFPQSIELDDRSDGRHPIVRFLKADAAGAVLDRVATWICENGVSGLSIRCQPKKLRKDVYRYITQLNLSQEDIDCVENSLFFAGASIGRVLILRGLFAGGILSFALGQKRWRVNYGIDPHRENGTKLAVPFRAKDSPTPRSEFSHPDVVITLTCLSYYYGGLDEEALFLAFRLLIKSENARIEYDEWARTAPTLPSSFRTLAGINLRDQAQCKRDIYPHLRYSKAAVDYYLSHLVFSKEAREFPNKLSASGWDLAKTKNNSTTGFSGTNDSRYVLPTDIKQLDLPEQKHTNALVLDYLLQAQNGVTLMPPEAKGKPFNSEMLLNMISRMDTHTRVILDVGAQVIDLNNLEFAKQWLSRYQDDDNTQAVVLFNDDDEIVVLDRTGKIEELEISPFFEQLDRCLVFLDESHTRGTDLKLPSSYRAVVTLGAGLTKDRLVQACMRMRKLGKGQSVEFCVPCEIEQKITILKRQEGSETGDITIADVLSWVITETCLDLRKAIPLWLNQGVRFSRQQALWSQDDTGSGWADQFLEDEAQSLDQRYRPRNYRVNIDSFLDKADVSITKDLRVRCDEFGITELHAASLQEEQERELSPETEQERQVEKPPAVEPETHRLSQALKDLVIKGHSLFQSEHEPAFQLLKSTSANQYLDSQRLPNSVHATLDFGRTVKEAFGTSNYSDSFQRPVQWILTDKCQAGPIYLVIISPFEAQELLPYIETSEHVTLHLYAPRVNLGFKALDHLQLYRVSGTSTTEAIPKSVIAFLNLFAGQLYLSSFEDYTNVCELLGLAYDAADDSIALSPDGFIPPGGGGKLVNKSTFSKSPVQFLRVLTEQIRQDGRSIEKTDMGKIFDGVRLFESDFRDRA